jgi:hypothetical protein
MPFIGSFGGKNKERENKTVIRVDIKKVFREPFNHFPLPITHICLRCEGVQMKTPTTFMTFVFGN